MHKKKKKIMIDLDVVTVGIWDKRGEKSEVARGFMQRVENNEFEVVTPFSIIELVLKWRYENLKEDIKEFYLNNTSKLLNDTDIRNQVLKEKTDPNLVLPRLRREGIKDEDSLLVFLSSIFRLDYLVTFNRKHLRNKKDKINKILRECNLHEIKIVDPSEV